MEIRPWQVDLTEKGHDFLVKHMPERGPMAGHGSSKELDRIVSALGVIDRGGNEWDYAEFSNNYPIGKLIGRGLVSPVSFREVAELTIPKVRREDSEYARVLSDYYRMLRGMPIEDARLYENIQIMKERISKGRDLRFAEDIQDVLGDTKVSNEVIFDRLMSIMHDTAPLMTESETPLSADTIGDVNRMYNFLAGGDIHDDAVSPARRSFLQEFLEREGEPRPKDEYEYS